MKVLNKVDFELIITGGVLLGTGGGADPSKGKALISKLSSVNLISLDQLNEEDFVFSIFMIGSSGANEDSSKGVLLAKEVFFELFADQFDKFKAIIPVELGGGVLGEALAMSNLVDLPLVDADIVGGRAAPEVFLETITLKGLKRTPLVVANNQGDVAVLKESKDYKFTESFLRSFAEKSSGVAYVCGYPLKVKEIKGVVAERTVSLCLEVGKQIKASNFVSSLKSFGFYPLGQGKVLDVTLMSKDGFLKGEYCVDDGEDRFLIKVKNENIVCKKNGKTIATSPDLICLYDLDKNEGVYNRDLKEGMSVLILFREAIPLWKSPDGINLFNPKNLGFGEDYVDFTEEIGIIRENFNKLTKNMKNITNMKLQTARGVRDIPPEEMMLKNKVVSTLREVFELYGFTPLETPIIERYETLAAKFGAGTSSDVLNETFKLTDQGKRKLGLRFELTTSLARFVAMNPTLKFPFKRYELGPVFRDGPIKLGRVRQFWQCDVDTIGTKSMLADAEIVSILQEVFNKLKLPITIEINNRKLLNGILEQAGIRKKDEAMVALDKLAKIGRKEVTKELKEKKFTAKQIKTIFSLIKENITLNELKKKVKTDEGKEGIAELEELFTYLKKMDIKSAKFDVSLARGLSYYTGTIFEVFPKKGKITSSLAAGGRWDDMVGKFRGGNQEVPAVGVSFGIVPIMEVLKEKEQITKKTPALVYVIPINTINESLKVVQQLRNEGLSTEFSLGKKGVSKNLQYANSLGIPYVIIIGEKELNKGKVLLRNMDSGQEQLLTVKDVVKKLNVA